MLVLSAFIPEITDVSNVDIIDIKYVKFFRELDLTNKRNPF